LSVWVYGRVMEVRSREVENSILENMDRKEKVSGMSERAVRGEEPEDLS
jgi:hypothetical protein